MLSLVLNCLLAFAATLTSSVNAQTTDAASTGSEGDGYVGYNLTIEGDGDSAGYATANTNSNRTYSEPDVFLNASVSVEEINIEVENLTAKVNLDLQVLELLQFNAGVDLSVDRVQLLIQDVKARVLLEARLENVVEMVDDVLSSLDLNPIIATLGQGIGDIVDETTDAVGGVLGGDDSSSESSSGASSGSGSNSTSEASSLAIKRSFEIENNILFSINDFSGNAHTNRVLEQNGDIVEQDLDNSGRVSGSRVVGSYETDMTFNGNEETHDRNGEEVLSKQYLYEPIRGVQAVAAIFFGAEGSVVGTQILSELEAGGFATIAANEE